MRETSVNGATPRLVAFCQIIVVTLSLGKAVVVNREQNSVVCHQPRAPPLAEVFVGMDDDDDDSGKAVGSFAYRFERLLEGAGSR